MAEDNKGMSAAEINRRMKQEMNAVKSRLKDQGLDDYEIKQIMQDYFAKNSQTKKQTKMTAARGGVAKKKMMRGGVAKKTQPKRMRGGGMAKMAKKKMMRGGVAKKK